MNARLYNNKLYAEINPLGAELSSLKDSAGIEYLWQGDPAVWSGRAPVLFPIVGAMPGGKYLHNGQEYNIKQHGFARNSTFKEVSSRSDAVTFLLESNQETKKAYPFDFSFYVSYELVEYSLVCRFKVHNRSAEAMPFGLGGHPGFNVPLQAGEQFEDYVLVFDRVENCDSPCINQELRQIDPQRRRPVLENTRTLPLNHEDYLDDALILENLQSRKVALFHNDSGHGIEVAFDGFDYLGIWQKPNANYLCIEPWTSTAALTTEDSVLAHKRGVILLQPGEVFDVSFKITVL